MKNTGTIWKAPAVVSVFLALGACSTGPTGEELTSEVGTAEATYATLSELVVDATLVDLTYAFDDNTIYWPTASGFELELGPNGYTDAGYYYAANQFSAAEHGGTHLDSPVHFFEAGDTADKISLHRLIGEGVVVDVRTECENNPDCQITVDDFLNWERQQGRELTDTLVLIRTGWGRFWPDREGYLGTAELGPGAVPKLHFPGLHPDAARWLAEERSIRAVGLDTASIDYGQSQLFESHVELFSHNIPVFENVANLEELPSHGFTLFALPMKIGGGSGGPLRIVALVPGNGESS